VSCVDYHHPVVLAKEMATIDLLSEGRLAEQLGATFGLSISEIMSHPHTLLGSVDYLCDELERRRDVYNISYVSIPEDQAVAFAPVVHRLADK
jgi:hypothetical protein